MLRFLFSAPNSPESSSFSETPKGIPVHETPKTKLRHAYENIVLTNSAVKCPASRLDTPENECNERVELECHGLSTPDIQSCTMNKGDLVRHASSSSLSK